MQRLNSLEDTINKEQLLFGINQGAIFSDIRTDHAKRISELDLDGYAIGGLAVGETHEQMYQIIEETVPYLPKNKPTYLMGVGTPANILEGVARGIDFFDCVYPSRNGRHGHVYTNEGKLNLFNQKYEKDMRPIEEGCQCPACRHYSRAYIRHLLQYHDGRDPGCSRCRKFCFLQRRKTVPDGTVKYKKCLKKPKRLAQRTEVV